MQMSGVNGVLHCRLHPLLHRKLSSCSLANSRLIAKLYIIHPRSQHRHPISRLGFLWEWVGVDGVILSLFLREFAPRRLANRRLVPSRLIVVLFCHAFNREFTRESRTVFYAEFGTRGSEGLRRYEELDDVQLVRLADVSFLSVHACHMINLGQNTDYSSYLAGTQIQTQQYDPMSDMYFQAPTNYQPVSLHV
jgi:hypothetical protein